MSGNELGTKGKASRGKKPIARELVPRLLTPTPAQLAAGERVIDADPQIWPSVVSQMVKRAEKVGWAVRVTYSEFLAVPPVTGADAGTWVHTHMLAVRLSKPWVGRAWGAWRGTERQGWGFDSAQFWGHFASCPVTVGATQLNGLITGIMMISMNEGTGRYHVEKIAKTE